MRSKKVMEFPLYNITDTGQVYSVRNNRYLKGNVDRYGYLHFFLYNNEGGKHHTAHRLVAIHFIEGNTLLQINHKDGNRLNNDYKNLEWVTAKENVEHSINVLGSSRSGSKNPSAKINEEQVFKIKEALLFGESQHSVAKRFKISRSTISMIAINKIWSHIKLNLHGNKKINSENSHLQESK